jgi:hypothetical protein
MANAKFLYLPAQPLTRFTADEKRAHRVTGLPEVVQGSQQKLEILAGIAESSREANAST